MVFILSVAGGAESAENMWDDLSLQPNATIQKIFASREVVGEDGKPRRFTSGVNPREGFRLYKLIKDNAIELALEVGLANGTSALYMCQAFSELGRGTLTSIDPFQHSQWGAAGLVGLKTAALNGYHQHIEEMSLAAMPRLLAAGDRYDLVFVDGDHRFDYTLLDCFYGFMLLKPGGFLVIDDVKHRGVGDVIKFMNKNYSDFLKLIDIGTMAVYKKIGEDKREWNHHVAF